MKLFIAALVILTALFACGLGLGATLGAGDGLAAPDDLDGLRQVFSRPVDAAQIKTAPATCVQQSRLVIPAGQICTLTIAPDSAPARRLTLQLTAGPGAALELLQNDVLPARVTLTRAEPVKALDVFQDGGTLTIGCATSAGGTSCQVVLVR